MEQQIFNIAVLGAVYMLFALGLTLSWGVLNILNLAHGSLFMSGAVLTYWVTTETSMSAWLALPCAMVAAGVAATLLELLVFRPIRVRIKDPADVELGILIASVAMAAVPVSAAIAVTGNTLKAVPQDAYQVKTFHIAGLLVSNIALIIIGVALVLGTALAIFVKFSMQGRALRALAFDPEVCGLLGISANKMASLTMFVSGALAGGAGVLIALQSGAVESHMGEPLLLKAFAVIILGGVGSIAGAMASAVLLAAVETIVQVYVDPGLTNVVAFVLIIALLVIRPQGLFSRRSWQRA